MKLAIELDKLSVIQKLELMEALWDDLSRNAADVPSPEWHRHVLEERNARIERGEAEYLHWEDAKRQVRDATS